MTPLAADLYSSALLATTPFLRTRDEAGRHGERLAVARWLAAADAADRRVLARAAGPVLDVGCGPGRHVRELARRGVRALGLDVSATAVAVARGRGAAAVEGDVFGPRIAAARWRTVLLLDGNIGIGGDPVALLVRVRQLLAPGGAVLAELDPPGTPSGPVRLRLDDGRRTSAPFRWARVAADAADGFAAAAGLGVADVWSDTGRWFARLA